METMNEHLVRRAEGFKPYSPYAHAECTNCERRQAGKRTPEPVMAPAEVDTRPGCYYVSVMNDSNATAFLAGPYTTHSEALSKVAAAKAIAHDRDPRGYWYAYGTCRTESAHPSALGAI